MGVLAGLVTEPWEVEGEQVLLFSYQGVKEGRELIVDGIASRHVVDEDIWQTTSEGRLMFEPIDDHPADCYSCSSAEENGTLIVVGGLTRAGRRRMRKAHVLYRLRRRYW